MKSEKIYDGITGIREDIIERAEKQDLKQHRSPMKKWWKAVVAAILAVVLISGAFLWPDGRSDVVSAYAIAEAKYPEMAPYPNEMDFMNEDGTFDSESFDKVYDAWRSGIKKQERENGYADGLEDYFVSSTRQFLSNTEGNNLIYSPLNLYMALCMMAELTDGNSRGQILDLLGSENIEELRVQASNVWNATYRKDGAVSSVLANSLWLNEDINFKQATMNTLAENYYASSYKGEMGSEEFSKALQEWLNSQTGGLLEEQAKQINLDSDTIMAIASTVYFQADWTREFDKRDTKSSVFHGTSGDTAAEFMYRSSPDTYYWSDRFGAISQRLENGGQMWFILPDEGVAVEDLLNDSQVMNLVMDYDNYENQKYLIINRSIPKFDSTSQMDLIPGLQALGITDILDTSVSDFTPMTDDTDAIYLCEAKHDARVVIDEDGVTAAAYIAMRDAGSSMPPEEEIDFVVDRPFLFVITTGDDLPLFVGIVNQVG